MSASSDNQFSQPQQKDAFTADDTVVNSLVKQVELLQIVEDKATDRKDRGRSSRGRGSSSQRRGNNFRGRGQFRSKSVALSHSQHKTINAVDNNNESSGEESNLNSYIRKGRKIFFLNGNRRNEVTAAGILLFTFDIDTQKIVFLLGKTDSGWAHFGGKTDLTDESIADCAMREFNEETYWTFSENNTKQMKQLIDSGICRYHYIKHSKQVIYLLFRKSVPELSSFQTKMKDFIGYKEITDFMWSDLNDISQDEYRKFFGSFVKRKKTEILEYASKIVKKYKFTNKVK